MKGSLKLKTVESIGYNALARVILFILQAVTSMILARRLASSDFGVVGFAMIFISFLSQFSDLGVSRAIIQRARLDERGLYTGFLLKSVLGVMVFAISFLVAPAARMFFDDPEVVNVVRVLSLSFVLNSLVFIPTCLLTRELNYRKLTLSQGGVALVNAAISIALALKGYRYWSIVAANICSTAVSVVLLNIARPIAIRFSLDKTIAKELLHFGTNLFFSGIIVFAIFNADNFIVGALRGSATLGYYALSFNWGSMVCGVLGAMVLSVLFPIFSKMQQDREGIRSAYLKVLEYVAFIGVLANLLLLVISREFLYFILGHGSDKWLPALTALRILCIYGVLRSLLEPVANVILALGNTGLLLKSTFVAAAVELGALYPAVRYFGIEGVAVVVTCAYALQYAIYVPALKKDLHLSVGDVLASLRPALLSAVVVLMIVPFAGRFLSFSVLALFEKLTLCTVGYFAVHGFITKWKLLRETRTVLGDLWVSWRTGLV